MNNLEKHSTYCINIQDQPPASLGKKILLIIKRWRKNSVSRRRLRNLPDYLLDDIGMDKQYSDKENEINKHIWK